MKLFSRLLVLLFSVNTLLGGSYTLSDQEKAQYYGYNTFNETGAYKVDNLPSAPKGNVLAIIIEGGHAGVNFRCEKCGPQDSGYTAKVSLYPSEEDGAFGAESDKALNAVINFITECPVCATGGSVAYMEGLNSKKGFGGSSMKKGSSWLGGFAIFYYMLGLDFEDGGDVDINFHFTKSELSEMDRFVFELTDEQGLRVKSYLDSLNADLRGKKKSYIPFGFNCVDYAQAIYQSSGLPGLYFEQKEAQEGDFSMTNPANGYAVVHYKGWKEFFSRLKEELL